MTAAQRQTQWIIDEALPRHFETSAVHMLVPDAQCAACGNRSQDRGIAQGLLATERCLYVVRGCRHCGLRWLLDQPHEVLFKR